ncbi:MAG TPA: hypothetical protein ENN72_02265 [Firmicutes bacterium]|nr:hypothetical protein [Bacillota bacterium]
MDALMVDVFGKRFFLFLIPLLIGLFSMKLHLAGEAFTELKQQLLVIFLPMGAVWAAFKKKETIKVWPVLLFSLMAWALIIFLILSRIRYAEYLERISLT